LSPFTDEAWNVVNARNLTLLGTWSTDEFNLHLVNGPFSLLQAGIFSILGVGIVQARVLSVLSVGLTILLLASGLRRALGRDPALIAAASFGTCLLVLYYGRLAYTENLVMLAMTAGVLLVGRVEVGRNSGRWGAVAGVLFGLAIATKAIAGFGVVGAMVAVAIVEGRRSAAVRRWLVGGVIGMAVVGATWLVVVFLPFRDAVIVDLNIWPHQVAPTSLGELLRRIAAYAFRSDGALPALGPIAAGAGLGVAATALGWRTLSPTARLFAIAAIGWIVVHLAVLLVASYRPNRYLLPLLPAAAILVGVGATVVRDRLRHRTSARRRLAEAVAAVAIAALVLPGLISFAGWMTRATYLLEPMQDAVAGILPPGDTIWGGFAPLVAMKAEVTTIVPWPPAPANVGESYTSRPVHWVASGNHDPPWIVPDSAGWAARRERICLPWGDIQVCVFELP
jgi:4-amino-4-deoxy-L-arabinose transferase-like glycosyltransferase